jgi:soluble lytic murein transglycosylase-like protein
MRLRRYLAALPPPSTRWGSPSPISSLRCDPGPVKDLIVSVFGVASEWAQSVAVRESHCTAGAYNSSGASGIFQIMMPMHSDLVVATCSSTSIFDAGCNARVAFRLFEKVGPSPWSM